MGMEIKKIILNTKIKNCVINLILQPENLIHRQNVLGHFERTKRGDSIAGAQESKFLSRSWKQRGPIE